MKHYCGWCAQSVGLLLHLSTGRHPFTVTSLGGCKDGGLACCYNVPSDASIFVLCVEDHSIGGCLRALFRLSVPLKCVLPRGVVSC